MFTTKVSSQTNVSKKLHHARGDEGPEAHRQNDSDKSFDGYKHDGVDAEVEGQVADDYEDTAVSS